MGYLGDKCKNLKTIDISGCIMLTDEGILQLTQVSYGILPEGLIRALFDSKDSVCLVFNPTGKWEWSSLPLRHYSFLESGRF